jgi:hypothetical protein
MDQQVIYCGKLNKVVLVGVANASFKKVLKSQ